MWKLISYLIAIVAFVTILVGLFVGLQGELKEEIYYQPGETRPSIRTIMVYPNAVTGLKITFGGGILGLTLCFLSLLVHFKKKELEKTLETTSSTES